MRSARKASRHIEEGRHVLQLYILERHVICMEKDSILFTTDEGEEIPFYVIEQTTLAGENFLLVTDSADDEEEADAYIMREVTDEDDQFLYELVDDDKQLEALSRVFEELLEDVDIQM